MSNDTSRKRVTLENKSPESRSSPVTCAASASDATFVIESVIVEHGDAGRYIVGRGNVID